MVCVRFGLGLGLSDRACAGCLVCQWGGATELSCFLQTWQGRLSMCFLINNLFSGKLGSGCLYTWLLDSVGLVSHSEDYDFVR